MVKKHKTLLRVLGGTLLFIIAFNFGGGRAQAATLAVDNNCTLNEAIEAVNSAADGNGCVKTGAAYGTSDTINLPAGTSSISASLPSIAKPLVVAGTGRSNTTLNFNNNVGFTTAFGGLGQELLYDVTIKDLTITGASEYAINLGQAREVLLSSVRVTDSEGGVNVSGSFKITIEGCLVEDNTDVATGNTDAGSGIGLGTSTLATNQKPTILITDTIVRNNSSTSEDASSASGLSIDYGDGTLSDAGAVIDGVNVTIRNSSVLNNTAETVSGLVVNSGSGPITKTKIALSISATTVAENRTMPDTARVITPGSAHIPVISGVYISGNLEDLNTFTNVTVANNETVVKPTDNRNSLSGFFGTLNINSANMKIVNVTVVGNALTQADSLVQFNAFTVLKVDVNLTNYPTITIDQVAGGSSSLNGLIAHNTTNGVVKNCNANVDLSLAVAGASGTLDVSPTNLGFNLSDDQSCTGYRYVANLYDTIGHEVTDNGGPVPTIKLLSGSPAINAGGQVLGISTDARGIPRNGFYSVGAYQGELLAATTSTPNASGTLANTGALAISAVVLGVILLIALLLIFRDYRNHRKPLVAVDPTVQYSFIHHIKMVTIPLFKYRLSIKVTKKNAMATNDPSGLHKF